MSRTGGTQVALPLAPTAYSNATFYHRDDSSSVPFRQLRGTAEQRHTGTLQALQHVTGRDVLDRLENLDVGTTATDIPIEVAANLFPCGLGIRLQERFAGQQHPRSAEATLGRAALDEGFLEGIQAASWRQTFDRRDTLARCLESQVRAGANGLSVDQHGAGPADLGLA